jgi:hypothetical protein
MKNPAVSMLLGIFLLGAVSLLFVAKNANERLDKDLRMTKSNADSLLKVAGSFDAGIKRVKSQNDSLSVKNEELKKSLEQTGSKLAVKDGEIWRTKKAADETSKKYNDLVSSQKNSEKQIAALKALNDQFGKENKNLMSRFQSLTDDNKQLNDRLLFAIASAKDNILMESTNKRGKLDVKGKKVRKIVATLNLQSEMKNPAFRIFDPNGVPLPDEIGSFDIKRINEKSTNSLSGNSMKIELSYLLSKKIGPGLYKIEMLNENKHLGNLLVRFR